MRLFFLTMIFFLFILPFSAIASQNWIEDVMEWTINGHFNRAEKFLNQKIAQTDSSLVPCFYLASVLNSKMTHYEEQKDAQKFKNLLLFIIRKSDRQLNKGGLSDSSRAVLYFYRGSAYGYLAYFQGQTGQWIKALDNGLKAVNDLNVAVELDSTLYEAYLGLGTYKYWRSTKLRLVLWLPFISDLREEGITDIKRALRSPSKSRYMAMHQLIYILIDYGRFDEAISYAQKAVELFPNSQFMWWAYAHAYFKSHQYKKAIPVYERLLQLIETNPESNPSHWLACEVRIAEIYRRIGKTDIAREKASLILQRKDRFPDTSKNRQRLKKALEIFNRIED
ncbi:MAG: tetratricopeptide repeat protein [Calditrichaeota bacterium]|nr:tetratricopeptide repeat protein [Calditrichota bacterium]